MSSLKLELCQERPTYYPQCCGCKKVISMNEYINKSDNNGDLIYECECGAKTFIQREAAPVTTFKIIEEGE